MLQRGGRVTAFDIREGMGAALIADQQRVALGKVARAFCPRADPYQAAIGVLATAGGNTLGDNRTLGVLAQMNHLGAGVGLLAATGQRHGIELTDRVVTAQNHTRVFPGDGRAGFHLSPGNMGIFVGDAAFGDEVVNAATTFLVAWIPVLHGGVLDLGILACHQLDHRRMQLVFIAHRRGAALQIADLTAFVGDDQGALELAGLGFVDAEIGGQLHRALHALGDIDEGAIGEYGRVQGSVEVVPLGNH